MAFAVVVAMEISFASDGRRDGAPENAAPGGAHRVAHTVGGGVATVRIASWRRSDARLGQNGQGAFKAWRPSSSWRFS
ncbi:hypothetical protein CRV15_33295 (plasmid) [Streptomyces clavuligerus]|uniref:Uncharacterized protein n=1 Tax=Streptomyces clavuligerus TaxID=1901 RepID=B5GMQ4_STRCL|nr:hypothetical protein D1794_30590 [Streptomyces clavuligerus]AXU17355.1 hypothetical protein D1794_32590 [Streptomyces clavuligerus]EDY47601.1 hypothetical protein SSCG_00628 [Streptomyces clavuligerus]EFG04559.1 Hypothetical protein SCLAV_p1073 [Streptomyces clavuligerus]QCS10424.1 hypothetical protein CRV15_33295 [Streptomyces clavuligerus]